MNKFYPSFKAFTSFICVLLIYLSTICYFYVRSGDMGNIFQSVIAFPVSHVYLAAIIFGAAFLVCYKTRLPSLAVSSRISVNILAFLFTLALFIGAYFRYNLIVLQDNYLFLLLVLAGNYCLNKKILGYLWCKFGSINSCRKTRTLNTYIFDIYPVRAAFLIIFIFWLPYYFVTYPGGVQWDTFSQINQYYGIEELTNHHPVISTLIMGSFIKLGRFLADDNLGVFMYNIFQSLLLVYAFSLFFKLMSAFKTPYPLRWVFLGFYSLITIWPAFAQLMIKDTLYTAAVCIFLYLIVSDVIMKYSSPLSCFKLIAAGAMVCLLRNNGVYIIGFTLMFILFCRRIRRKRLLLCLSIPVFIFYVFVKVILPICDIPAGSKREMLSIPFQQTARYVQMYGNEMSETNKQIINNVLDYEGLAQNYNPELSDPVKATYKENSSVDEFIQYLKVWLRGFFTHPSTYIAATLNNTYGYYSLEAELKGNNDPYFIESNRAVNTGDFNIYNASPFYKDGINILLNLRNIQMRLPVINLFFNMGFYTWLLIFFLARLIAKHRFSDIVVLVPSLTSVLICIASPVNTYLRYMLPVMACMPLVVSSVIYVQSNH